ncbi:hypothetical protein L249_5729 [Ophiocordyceps polyrhachis-furcata BCC 54312]|uniref:CobW/HypB/UreG nucleotide-binding domain-containing protein n=1 Tax=Ophiocordyceps polyrhachis-furcata BCC 54312 TaxID=1330021 RepID=A0A367L0L9_9HYPO|nr:hypothetical protein L249_5729 [Ophiocordyceps polyrhachis-furcata BCC 54312]
MAPIPITIVTGFLGSGKTTLILNLIPQLLSKNPSYRLALLKNEFGSVAVDSQLASAAAISGVRELLGGCICCNLVGGLGPALAELDQDVKPERVVIETSGSAFPATLAIEVNRLARETGRYVLDGVVSVIDVENWKGYEDTSYTAQLQARYTDLVVFNKWESAGEARYEECLDRLGDLDVDVARVKSQSGRVDVDLIFGIDRGLSHQLNDTDKDTNHKRDHDHQSEVEVLTVELQSFSTCCRRASLPSLQKLLTTAPKDEVYRIKAIASLSSVPQNSDSDAPPPEPSAGRYILNWAFGRWTFTALPDGDGDGRLALRMTVILARGEANKWKKRLEAGGLVELDMSERGQLTVERVL